MENQGNKKVKKTGSRKRLAVILVLVAVVCVAVVLLGSTRRDDLTNVDGGSNTFTVRRDNLTVTVVESGTIKARETTDIMCQLRTRGVEIVSIVPEGMAITQEDVDNGMVLCQLNSSELEDRYNQELISFSTAKANKTEAEESYLIQQKQNESDITTAELGVKFSLMDFEKYLGEAVAQRIVKQLDQDPNATIDIVSLLDDPNLAGEGLQTSKQLKDSITLATSRYERASDKLIWTQRLREKEYVSETELKADELEVESLGIQKEQAETSLRLFKLYDFPKQTEQLLSNYFEAKRELVRTLAGARSKLAQAEAKRESTIASYNLQKDQLDRLEKEIAACTIRAPSPGIVVYGSSTDFERRRQDPIEVGDSVYHGQKIIAIPSSNRMGVEVGVHESSVDKVKPGQHATITVEAFPDKVFEGEVLKIAPLANPQHRWFSTGVQVYTTDVSINGSHDFLKPGMSTKVEILVEELHDVMIVPIQVVANQGGRKFCHVTTPQGPQPRQVQTGSFNDTFVQITDGLQIGEQVLLNPPRLVETTTTAKVKRPPREAQEARQQHPTEAGDRAEARADTRPADDPASLRGLENLSAEEKAAMRERLENISAEERQKLQTEMVERLRQGSDPVTGGQ